MDQPVEPTPHTDALHEKALRDYYDRRAPEFEAVYRGTDPQRLRELGELADAVRGALPGRRVLEVACGTGYWTARAAEVAAHIVATDASEPMLRLARDKNLASEKVEFRIADAYELDALPGRFDAGLVMFWISHVPKSRVRAFLDGLHARLGAGAVVFLADNVDVPGVGGPAMAKPGCADSFKIRELSDGSRYEVLKNYYDTGKLRGWLAPTADELHIHFGRCYWWARYRVRQSDREREK